MTIDPLPLGPRERDEQSARLVAARALEREAAQNQAHARDDAALALALRERNRLGGLARRGLVPQQQADMAANAATTAAAEAEAARQRARAAAAGELLLTIGELDHLEVVVELLSAEAVRLRAGMPAMLEGWGGNRPLRAQVRVVERYAFTKVSALGVEEQRTRVVLDFVDRPGTLGDGIRVTTKIETGRAEGATVIPSRTLFRCADQWCVAAIDHGRIARRAVQIGLRNATEAQIMSGLAAGAKVVKFPGDAPPDDHRVRIRR